MSSNYTIYKGHVWKEYGSNKLLLTLDGATAGALQAAIPLFIALVGPSTWILIAYPWFQSSDSRCTPYASYLNTADLLTTIGFNPTQLATAERISANLEMSSIFNSVNGGRAAALLASQTVFELLQTKFLPVDQWQIEVSNWFDVSLAKLQEGIVEFAGGPTDPEIIPFIKFPVDTDTARLCYNQLVQLPPGYVNFDFGAIIIVTVLGFATVLVGLTFESIAEFIIKRRGGQVKDWLEDGQFQLLKKVHEHQGIGDWEREESGFPIPKLASSGTGHSNGAAPNPSSGSANAVSAPNSGVPLQPLGTGPASSTSTAPQSTTGPGTSTP